MKKRELKIILIILAAALLVFLILDFNYFWFYAKYYFSSRTTVTTFSNPPSTNSTSTPTGQPNFLTIASLNIEAPIVYIDQVGETAFQAGLKNGVVHYPGTAEPGQNGNCYIFGHSSDYIWSNGKYKTVFTLLPRIKIGDKIAVSDKQGHVFTYVAKQTKVVAPTDLQYLNQDYGKKILTLQTSYPIGTALKRFIVIAELEN